jgi:hypothetical protein
MITGIYIINVLCSHTWKLMRKEEFLIISHRWGYLDWCICSKLKLKCWKRWKIFLEIKCVFLRPPGSAHCRLNGWRKHQREWGNFVYESPFRLSAGVETFFLEVFSQQGYYYVVMNLQNLVGRLVIKKLKDWRNRLWEIGDEYPVSFNRTCFCFFWNWQHNLNPTDSAKCQHSSHNIFK